MDFLKDFGVNPILLAAQVVNFVILLFILKKLLYKPLLKVLEERKQKIADSLKNAEEIEKRLLKVEEDKDNILAKATNESQKILDEVKKERESIRMEARMLAAADAQAIVKKGQEEAKAEKEKMMEEIRSEASKIVVLSLQKIIGKLLKKDQVEILEREIKNIS